MAIYSIQLKPPNLEKDEKETFEAWLGSCFIKSKRTHATTSEEAETLRGQGTKGRRETEAPFLLSMSLYTFSARTAGRHKLRK